MTKSSTAPMDTHLALELTTLSVAALITRVDGQTFRVTTSSEDVDIDIGDGLGEQAYSASEGVARTNIASDAELNPDNIDLLGVFNSTVLDETELRRGLFDFADFKLFVFNHQDTGTSMGIVKTLRGQFGRIMVTKQNTFRVTVLSITELYSKETGEYYTKDCKADVGDIRCTVPIFPDILPVASSLALGDVYRIPVTPDPTDCAHVILNFEGVDASTTFTNDGTQGDPTANDNAQLDTAQFFGGAASGLFDGAGDFLSWTDANWQDIGTNEFTVQARVRLNSTGILQTIISKHHEATSDRSFYVRINASDQVEFSWSLNGTSQVGTITSTTTISAGGSFTHIAVTRDTAGDMRLFINGTQEGGTTNETGAFFNSDEDFRIGALESGGVGQFFDGWIDNLEFINSFPRWTGNFTPPTGLLAIVSQTYIWEDYGDKLYEVTTAGLSADCIATPDTTVTNTHNQGAAVLTANHSWMRFAEVSAVSGTPRRIFTVTELTPTSGETVGTNRLPLTLGFPNDWFNGGAVLFETSDNAGISGEVRNFVEGAGTQDIELFEDMPFTIQIGDKLRLFPGCDKTNPTCIAKFNNGINFVGEPYVPGSDILGQYPDAR